MELLSIEEPGFHDWLQTEREQFPLLACGVYARLLDQAQTAGRLEEALTAGLKLVLLDPLQEHVHRALMRIYAAQGRYDAAKPIWRSGGPAPVAPSRSGDQSFRPGDRAQSERRSRRGRPRQASNCTSTGPRKSACAGPEAMRLNPTARTGTLTLRADVSARRDATSRRPPLSTASMRPQFWVEAYLAAVRHVRARRERHHVQRRYEMRPDFRLNTFRRALPYRNAEIL